MQTTLEQLAGAAGAAACEELTKALSRINHCVDQLTEEQVWSRPTEAMNSIANLVLHLAGNVRQFIVSGIGGAPDVRDRPREFSERGPIARQELLARLEAAVSESQAAIRKTPAEDWLRPRFVQKFTINGFEALFISIPHFRGHTQEIIHMTRVLLGDAYKFA